MPAICDKCGGETKIEQAYYKIQHWSSSEVRRRCPECWLKAKKGEYWNLVWTYLVIGAIGTILILAQNPLGWFCWNLVFFYLFLLLTAVPHELGHAFMAKAVGHRVYYVIIG